MYYTWLTNISHLWCQAFTEFWVWGNICSILSVTDQSEGKNIGTDHTSWYTSHSTMNIIIFKPFYNSIGFYWHINFQFIKYCRNCKKANAVICQINKLKFLSISYQVASPEDYTLW